MLTTLLFLALWVAPWSEDTLVDKYRAAAVEKFGNEISKLEEKDQKVKDPANAILFIGSSSIRLWETIADDLKPWPAIQRGFGGSTYSDVAVFAPRLIRPHDYRALAIFVANDITGGDKDKSPEEIVALLDRIVKESKAHKPKAKVFVIAITPTEKRWAVWDKIRVANASLESYCKQNEGLVFVATEKDYLNEEGKPRTEYFREDKLHQNNAGYQVWSRIIRSTLEKELGSP